MPTKFYQLPINKVVQNKKLFKQMVVRKDLLYYEYETNLPSMIAIALLKNTATKLK